jgi:hypothetical protein
VPAALGEESDHAATQIVQGLEQGERPAAYLAVGFGPDMADAGRQTGLRALERPTLRFLISAQDWRLFRLIEKEPDHIQNLASKCLSLDSLKVVRQVRLDGRWPPTGAGRGLRHADHDGHCPTVPARQRLWWCDRAPRARPQAPATACVRDPRLPNPTRRLARHR